MIDQMDAWQRWWSGLDGTPGEIVWDSADSDLDADLDIFAPHFDPQLPVIDLGCGDGRQTRRLARHFATVVGVDIAPAAVELARGVDNPSHVCFRVLDTRSTHEAEHIHREFGPANVNIHPEVDHG